MSIEREILGLENPIMDLPQGCGTENGGIGDIGGRER